MKRLLWSACLGLFCLGVALAAEDPPEAKKPDEKKPTTPQKIDWGKYVDAGKISGEVEKVGKDGFKLKVVIVTPPTRPGNMPKKKTEEHDFLFHENGVVRWAKLPTKLDDKGKKTQWTPKEMTDFKLPLGAPGYAADRATLQDGHLVEVTYARPKDLKPADAVTSDFRVKYVVILSDPGAAPKKDKEEKKDDKKKDDKKKPEEKKPEEKKP